MTEIHVEVYQWFGVYVCYLPSEDNHVVIKTRVHMVKFKVQELNDELFAELEIYFEDIDKCYDLKELQQWKNVVRNVFLRYILTHLGILGGKLVPRLFFLG